MESSKQLCKTKGEGGLTAKENIDDDEGRWKRQIRHWAKTCGRMVSDGGND